MVNNEKEKEDLDAVEEEGTWKTFLFDPEHKTVLGRNAWSWFNVTLFYLGYYSLIAVISYYSILGYQNNMVVLPGEKNSIPRTQTRVASPGVGTFPGVEHIMIDSNRVSTFGFIDKINTRLMSIAQDETKRSQLSDLGECSPICSDLGSSQNSNAEDDSCKFPPLRRSYAAGNPCIFYQINKVILWKPYPFTSLNDEHIQPKDAVTGNSMISEVVEKFDQDLVYFYCYDLDLELGYVNQTDRVTMNYYSSDLGDSNTQEYGVFKSSHWPIPMGPSIKDMENPFVAVKFNINEKYHGTLINVACQAYAANLGPNDKINEAYAATSITVHKAGESTIAQINDEFFDREE